MLQKNVECLYLIRKQKCLAYIIMSDNACIVLFDRDVNCPSLSVRLMINKVNLPPADFWCAMYLYVNKIVALFCLAVMLISCFKSQILYHRICEVNWLILACSSGYFITLLRVIYVMALDDYWSKCSI